MAHPAPRILVVDDEHINVEFFQVMLSRLGYEVSTASDGDTALERIVGEHPDLVLLDNILPGRTGWEITRLVKRSDEYRSVSDVAIIMFSAMDDVEDKVEGFQLGIADYITKPFNFSEVLARIQSVLRQRELSRQVVRRERRLGLVESLNNSLIYFTRHIKEPLSRLREQAGLVDASDANAVQSFLQSITSQTEEFLATVEALEEQVQELTEQGDQLKAKELSLADLEDRFRKHAAMALHDADGGSV